MLSTVISHYVTPFCANAWCLLPSLVFLTVMVLGLSGLLVNSKPGSGIRKSHSSRTRDNSSRCSTRTVTRKCLFSRVGRLGFSPSQAALERLSHLSYARGPNTVDVRLWADSRYAARHGNSTAPTPDARPVSRI